MTKAITGAKTETEARAILLEAGIKGLKSRAGYQALKTGAALPTTCESFYEMSIKVSRQTSALALAWNYLRRHYFNAGGYSDFFAMMKTASGETLFNRFQKLMDENEG